MLICPFCSFSNPETAEFCLGCGAELPLDPSLSHSMGDLFPGGLDFDQEEDSLPKRVIPATQPSMIDEDEEILGDMESALNSLLDATPIGTNDDNEDDDVDEVAPSQWSPPPQQVDSSTADNLPDLQEDDDEPHTRVSRFMLPPNTIPPQVSPPSETNESKAEPRWHREQTEISRLNPDELKQLVRKATQKQKERENDSTHDDPSLSPFRQTIGFEESQIHPVDRTSEIDAPPANVFLQAMAAPPETTSNKRTETKKVEPTIHRPEPTAPVNINELRQRLQHMQQPNTNDAPLEDSLSLPAPPSGLFPLPDFDDEDNEETAQHHYPNPTNLPEPKPLPGEEEATSRQVFLSQPNNQDEWWSGFAPTGTIKTVRPPELHSTSDDVQELLEADLEEDGPIEELGPDSLIEDAYEDDDSLILPTQKKPIPPELWEQDKARQNPALSVSNDTSQPVSSLLLHFELTEQEERPLRRGRRMIIQSNLISRVKTLLGEHEITLHQEQKDRLIAISYRGRAGLRAMVQLTCQLLEEKLAEQKSTDLRIQLRAYITTQLDESPPNNSETNEKALQAMPSQSIWLDWSSYQQLRKEYYCEEVQTPGHSEPIYELSWSSHQHIQNDQTLLHRMQYPFVGRKHHLQQLSRSWLDVRAGQFRMVVVQGEPGSGRTRLIQSWAEQIQQEAQQFWAGSAWCPDAKVSSPYIASLLHSHIQKHKLNSYQELYQRTAFLAQSASPNHDVSWEDRSAALLTISNNDAIELDAVQDALSWYIHATTTKSPTLIVLDDLHLADASVQHFLTTLFRHPPTQTLVVVLSTRGEYERLFHNHLQQAVRLDLKGLSNEESLQLLQGRWPQNQPWNETEAEKIVREAEGNPRILVAMLNNYLQKQGHRRESTWINELAVPNAVEELLLRKLRGLSSLEKDTLRKAAILGEEFWQEGIECLERMELHEGDWSLREGIEISTMHDRTESLHQLESKELIHSQPPSEHSMRMYRFQQRFLRQVLWRQVPIAVRRQMHRRIAEWLILNTRGNNLKLIIEHLRQAGAKDKAASYLFQAGQKAQESKDYTEALRLFGEGLESLEEEDSSLRLQMLYQLASTYAHLGDLSATIHLCEVALQLSWRLTNPYWGAQTYLLLGQCHGWRGNTAQADDCLLNAQVLAQRSQHTDLRLAAAAERVRINLAQTQQKTAKLRLQDYRELRKSLSSRSLREQANLHQLEGWLYRLQGKWADAHTAYNEAESIYDQRNQDTERAKILVDRGELAFTVGDDEAAQTLLGQAIQILRENQANRVLIRALLLLGHVSILQRDTQTALEVLREAWQASQTNGDPQSMSQVASALSAAYVLVHQTQDALHFSRFAEQKLQEGLPLSRAMCFFFLGEAAAGLQDTQANQLLDNPPAQLPEGGIATYFFVKALEILENTGERGRYCLALLGLSRALTARGLLRASNHVLNRGIRDAENYGLGILLERLRNQKRLIQPEAPQHAIAPHPSGKKSKNKRDQATLVVRSPKRTKKQPSPPPQEISTVSDSQQSTSPRRNSPNTSWRQGPKHLHNTAKPSSPHPHHKKK